MSVYLAITILSLIVGIVCGVLLHKYQIRFHKYLSVVFHYLLPRQAKTYGPYSIGIYEGLTPFELSDPEEIANPVLTGADVVDIDARFVADPFIVFKDGGYTMFFEAMNRQSNLGEIGYAQSSDGRHWQYEKIVIREKFHLSYPYVFEWNNDYFMIPESCNDLSVRLYKARSFPDDWQYIGNILSGYSYVDASVFRHQDKWWLFVSTPESDSLNLYYSNELMSDWTPHPMNPIVKHNKHIARPGGRVVTFGDKTYRLTQDDFPTYGIQVFAFEITELSEETYKENPVMEAPVVTGSGHGWNAKGMHHVDLHKIGGKFIAAVDGESRNWKFRKR